MKVKIGMKLKKYWLSILWEINDLPTKKIYTRIVRGIHNYYNKATCIYSDLSKIYYNTNRFIKSKMKNVLSFGDVIDNITKEIIGKTLHVRGKPLLEIGKVTY